MSLCVVVLDDVEDEALMLADMVRNAYDEEGLVVHALGSIGELECYLSTNDSPDVLFIDIVLGTGNGIDLVGRLSLSVRTQVIYVSGLDDFYTRVYDTPHASYVRKPLRSEDVRLALSQALERRRRMCAPPLVLHHDRVADVIRSEEIYYIESNLRNVIVHTDAGAHRAYGKLSDVLNQLPPSFVRCHQSYAINLDRVSRLGAETVTLSTGETVPVSRRWRASVREALFDRIREGR